MASPGEAAPDRSLAEAERTVRFLHQVDLNRSEKQALYTVMAEFDRRGRVEAAATALVREWERIEDEYDNWRLEGVLVALAETLGRDPGDTEEEADAIEKHLQACLEEYVIAGAALSEAWDVDGDVIRLVVDHEGMAEVPMRFRRDSDGSCVRIAVEVCVWEDRDAKSSTEEPGDVPR